MPDGWNKKNSTPSFSYQPRPLALPIERNPMISDARIRAHLLSVFHGLRSSNDGWVPTSDMNLGGMEAVSLGRIRNVCEQLAEADLIKFKPLPSGSGSIVGMCKITGHGSDVAEGLSQASIALEFSTPSGGGAEERMTEEGLFAGRSADAPILRGDVLDQGGSRKVEVATVPAQPVELFALRPTLWGMSIDLKEAYRRVRRRFGS
jgi:hypothetical protein